MEPSKEAKEIASLVGQIEHLQSRLSQLIREGAEKDAEIERLKAEKAEAVRLLDLLFEVTDSKSDRGHCVFCGEYNGKHGEQCRYRLAEEFLANRKEKT